VGFNSRNYHLTAAIVGVIRDVSKNLWISGTGEMHFLPDDGIPFQVVEMLHRRAKALAVLLGHGDRHSKLNSALHQHTTSVDHAVALVHGWQKALLHVNNYDL
jgi:hypothetical protein